MKTGQFWTNANSNSLDHCVLEWCKLFADPKGKHYFDGIVDDAAAFRAQLLAEISMTDAEFETYVKKMKTYRDKFVAHLDRDETMFIPWLRPARRCISFLYDHIAENENGYFPGGLRSARDFYSLNINIGRAEFADAQAT